MAFTLVISGPAGVGKTTICERLLEEFGDELSRVVTTTTRSPRSGEVDGKDYYFTEINDFKNLAQENAFLEYEMIHGNYYGTSKKAVFEKIGTSKNILINIDVRGAQSLRKEMNAQFSSDIKVVSIFLKPSNLDVLKERLFRRGSDSKENIEKRLETAKAELEFAKEFDHEFISTEKDPDYSMVKEIYLKNRQ